MTGRQLLALPAQEQARYWNQAAYEQGLNVAERYLQTSDRDLQAAFLELLRALARPVQTN